jgi:hypothetical protein
MKQVILDIIVLLILSLTIATFSSCNSTDDAVDASTDKINKGNEIVINDPDFITIKDFGGKDQVESVKENETVEIEIIDPTFIKILGIKDPTNIGREAPVSTVNEYKIGDTMAIVCWVHTFYNVYNVDRDGPLPIVAKVTSSETGDVQYITFVRYPFWIFVDAIMNYHIAYISPVKSELNTLLPDPTRKELNISPNGDVLTAEIIYKNQILTKTITVKGE